MKDSKGNDLPKGVWLNNDASLEELGKALTINFFNLAAAKAMKDGATVIYDEANKTAEIQNVDGFNKYY